MQKFKENLLAFWEKVKAFMLKKWYGAPMYLWVVLLPLLLMSIGYFLWNSRTRKNKI